MLKCKVFRSEYGYKDNCKYVKGPEYAFNDFCERYPEIQIIKIDTICFGKDNNDRDIYLYYIDDIDESNKKEVIVRNFKCGDKVIWHNNGLSFHAEILKTFKITCIIRYDDGITYQEEEVPYYSILNREVLEDD